MRKKGLNTSEEIYDQLGIRILVPDVGDLYAALGVVHTLWRPIKGEFDDYIANPKENQYRSLHTAVYGPEGKNLEVQIRTPEMDRIADIGIAAHWRYKSQDRHDEAFERKIQWLRSIIEWASQDNSQPNNFLATVKEDLFEIGSTCSRPRASRSICRWARPRLTLPTRSTPRSGIAVGGPRSTASRSAWTIQLKTGEPMDSTAEAGRRSQPGLAQS